MGHGQEEWSWENKCSVYKPPGVKQFKNVLFMELVIVRIVELCVCRPGISLPSSLPSLVLCNGAGELGWGQGGLEVVGRGQGGWDEVKKVGW